MCKIMWVSPQCHVIISMFFTAIQHMIILWVANLVGFKKGDRIEWLYDLLVLYDIVAREQPYVNYKQTAYTF